MANTTPESDATEALEDLLVKYHPILELKPMPYSAVIEIQRTVYHFVHTGSQIGNNMREAANVREVAGSSRIKLLRAGFDGMVRQHLEAVRDVIVPKSCTFIDVQLSDFLKRYSKSWEQFQMVVKSADLFCAVNTAETGAGASKSHEFRRVVLDAWHSVVFEPMKDQLVNAVLYLLKKERAGDNIEGKVLELYRQSLEKLAEVSSSNNNNGEQNERKNLSDTYLVKPVLAQTRDYYAQDGSDFLQNHSQIEYIDNLSARVLDEQARALKYLGQNNASELTKAVVNALITEQVERISQGFMDFVKEKRMECLRKQIGLVMRTGNMKNMQPLVDQFKGHIINEGETKMKSLPADVPMKDPGCYVSKLAELHAEYAVVVKDGTAAHASFEQAMSEAMIHIVNLTLYDQTDVGELNRKQQNVSRTAEILARYCDMLLRKGNRSIASDDDLEKALQNFNTVFKYMNDKDAFKQFYQKHLARRLINNQHTSIDREGHVLALLKNSQTQEYTRHMETMLKDFQQSTDMSREFSECTMYRELKTSRGIAFDINVLSSNSWPYTSQEHSFVPPEELQLYMAKFTEFYRSKNSSKKLSWLHQYSKCDVQIAGFKQPYEVGCSTHQAAVLMLFNTASEWTVENMRNTIKLNLPEIKQQLGPMLESKLLMIPGQAAVEAEDGDDKTNVNLESVSDETKILINPKFVSKRVRFQFGKAGQQESKEDIKKAYADVQREKGFWIDAAIVRIMKARQKMPFRDLTQEVFKQAQGRFPVNSDQVKKQCEGLIDKEYIKRDEADKNVYIYVA